jgi:hypothetical protein
MPRITKRLVDAAEARSNEYFVWDSEIRGFGLRVPPSGRKGYVVQYRAGRRSRRISLGPSTVLTCEQARNRAVSIVATARNGADPAAERDAGRKAITVKELAERFDREHIAIRVKVSTAKEYLQRGRGCPDPARAVVDQQQPLVLDPRPPAGPQWQAQPPAAHAPSSPRSPAPPRSRTACRRRPDDPDRRG